MVKKMKINEKITIDTKSLIIVIVAILIAILIGLSYAWFGIVRNSNSINKIKAGSLEMTLDDTATEGIKLLNEVPRSYLQGMKTEEYTFTLTNTGTITSDYTIYLDDVLTFTDEQGKEVTITDENKLEDTKIRYILLKDDEKAAANKSKLLSESAERSIDTGKITKNQTIKYSMRVWIDSRAENEVMGKKFNAKLRVEANQVVTRKIVAENLEIQMDKKLLDGIAIVNATPKTYEDGIKTEEYKFSLTNTDSRAKYEISLSDLNTYKDENNNRVDLSDEFRIDDSKIKYLLLKDDEIPSEEKAVNLTNRTIDKGIIEKNQTIKYSLRMWVDSTKVTNESEIAGKAFNAELNLKREDIKVCKRAVTLHTEKCTQTDSTYYCSKDGYALNDTLTYGSLGVKGSLTTGDAFDCDVNGDGVYDATTERFYYVSDMINGKTVDSDTAVLIYYNNVNNGQASANSTFAYDLSGKNNNGPVTAIMQLPKTSQWTNVSLKNTVRPITNQLGTNITGAGKLPSSFSYEGYAARFLTTQEVSAGCGFTVGNYKGGELNNKCLFMYENTRYALSSLKTYSWWLENALKTTSTDVWDISGDYRVVGNYSARNSDFFGVRPAIEVAKTDIDY